MLVWYKNKMNKIISYSFIFLFLLSLVYAAEDCEGKTYVEDIPCLILLPYSGECSGVTVSVNDENTTLYTQTMENYSINKCNATFNQTALGTYALSYSTGDTGTIVVDAGYQRMYLYISLFIITIFLILAGYYYENPHIHFLSGLLLTIMAIDIYFQGFPRIADTFMTNSISIILAGMGMYYLVAPYLVWFKNNEGSL